jgi:hypothetical protein
MDSYYQRKWGGWIGRNQDKIPAEYKAQAQITGTPLPTLYGSYLDRKLGDSPPPTLRQQQMAQQNQDRLHDKRQYQRQADIDNTIQRDAVRREVGADLLRERLLRNNGYVQYNPMQDYFSLARQAVSANPQNFAHVGSGYGQMMKPFSDIESERMRSGAALGVGHMNARAHMYGSDATVLNNQLDNQTAMFGHMTNAQQALLKRQDDAAAAKLDYAFKLKELKWREENARDQREYERAKEERERLESLIVASKDSDVVDQEAALRLMMAPQSKDGAHPAAEDLIMDKNDPRRISLNIPESASNPERLDAMMEQISHIPNISPEQFRYLADKHGVQYSPQAIADYKEWIDSQDSYFVPNVSLFGGADPKQSMRLRNLSRANRFGGGQ